jgi:L-ascorbate metabolism protein UlaG (beta-lactamase superfamily)
MQVSRLSIVAVALGAAACGCNKDKSDTETAETAAEDAAGKEAAMGMTIQWLGHASFRICYQDTVIYIDPWKLKNAPHDATLVLVSHSHHDHYSPQDIAKVSGPQTKLIASPDVIAKQNGGEAILDGLTIELGNARLVGVAAYNPNKQFHPKSNNWVGFVIVFGSKRLYYAGDTDLTAEMKALKGIDVALLPVGGTYTMDATEAAEAVKFIKPKLAIPYHWGDIVGSRGDAEKFAQAAECNTKILTPGQTFNVE